jgi:hypothetical protein
LHPSKCDGEENEFHDRLSVLNDDDKVKEAKKSRRSMKPREISLILRKFKEKTETRTKGSLGFRRAKRDGFRNCVTQHRWWRRQRLGNN